MARGTFKITPRAQARLEDLAEEEQVSQAEIIRRALGIYDWLTDQLAEGKKLIVETPESGEKSEVVFPHGPAAKNRKRDRDGNEDGPASDAAA